MTPEDVARIFDVPVHLVPGPTTYENEQECIEDAWARLQCEQLGL